MKVSEQLTEKLQPEKKNRIISIVDFKGSTSGDWTSTKILYLDPATRKTTLHSEDFDRDLTDCEHFENYLKENQAEFVEKAGGDHDKMRTLATKGFVIKNSQWNSYWRGKVAGGLIMALSLMTPNNAKQEDLDKCGIGRLIDQDVSNMHVTIAVCIDGGPVTQEEQRTVTTIIDEVVFDLRRRGADWSRNTPILTDCFPDAESFVKSLNGERNIMRTTTRFPTPQRDEWSWKGEFFSMGQAWEVPVKAQTREDCSASMFRAGMTIKEALAVEHVAKPATLLQIAKTDDTVGVKRMIDANCSVEEAKT